MEKLRAKVGGSGGMIRAANAAVTCGNPFFRIRFLLIHYFHVRRLHLQLIGPITLQLPIYCRFPSNQISNPSTMSLSDVSCSSHCPFSSCYSSFTENCRGTPSDIRHLAIGRRSPAMDYPIAVRPGLAMMLRSATGAA